MMLFIVNHYTIPLYATPENEESLITSPEIYEESEEPSEGHEGIYYDDTVEDIRIIETTVEIPTIEQNTDISSAPVQEIKNTVNSQGTADEEYLLAGVIMGEAMGEDLLQKLYVGSVVLNRVSDKRFPNTIYGVLTQSGQYSCISSKGNFHVKPDVESIAAAKKLLTEGSKLPSKVVWQANFKQGTTYLKYGNIYYGY